jgi:hypothetical protein
LGISEKSFDQISQKKLNNQLFLRKRFLPGNAEAKKWHVHETAVKT